MGRPGAGGPEKWKTLYMENIVSAMHAILTSEIPLAWNRRKNVPALYKRHQKFTKEPLKPFDPTYGPIPPAT